MKLKPTTIFLMILSFSLGIIVFVTQIWDKGFNLNPNESEEIVDNIFPFTRKDINIIKLQIPDTEIIFKRENKSSSWKMIAPEKTEANDASIAFLLNLLPNAKKEVEISPTDSNLEEYSLSNSQKKISLTLNNGKLYEITLGKSNFDDTRIYALVSFPPELESKSAIFLVSKSFQYALERDFSEWKQ